MHQVAVATSVSEHLLSSYQQSFNAVTRAQLVQGGSERLRQLWHCKFVQCMLTETMGMRQETLQQLLAPPEAEEGAGAGAAAAAVQEPL